MIASQAMVRETRQSLQKAEWDPIEHPVSMQLAGCEPHVMAEAAKLNADRGAAIIDINMGCPVKKVVNGHAGSALMRSEEHTSELQSLMRISYAVFCLKKKNNCQNKRQK